jgi:hypothetical protein
MEAQMKKILSLFVLILTALAAPFLAIGSQHSGAMSSMAVQIPLELKLAINGLFLFAVMYGLQWVFDQIGLDLRGIGAAAAASVSEFAILQFQGLINLAPAQYDVLISVGLSVLLAILTSLGFFRLAFQRERAAVLWK